MKLIEIDLSIGQGHEHPDINSNDDYLAEIQWPQDKKSFLVAGHFSREWYGWNFNWFWSAVAGLQFDTPGSNHSCWKRLWRIEK